MGKMSPYPEQPSRVETILAAIKHRNIGQLVEPADYGLDPILAVHSAKYVDYLQRAFVEWLKKGGDENGVIADTFAVHLRSVYRDISLKNDNILSLMGLFSFDAATVIGKETYEAAYEAAQVALTAADRLVIDQRESAYALCRPPGHHSSSELLGGFCFLNNAAIASQFLISKYNKRIAIIDIDYHHGNGTQETFYDKSNPLFVSLHDSEADPYYWGTAEETGEGEGKGFNVNIPLPSGTGNDAYLEALEKVLRDKIIPYYPDILVVSLGVDTFELDPVGTFKITTDCYTKIGALLAMVQKPTLFVQEGGYDSADLGNNVCNVLKGFESYNQLEE
jgi:acetoin utilization deacetylase AcuC-like enzyme